MRLLTTSDINTAYAVGLTNLTNITYNKLAKDSYAVQYKNTNKDNQLLMLMYAVDSWDNREGACNWLTELQLEAILNQIAYSHRDNLTKNCSTSTPADCGCTSSTLSALSVMDTESIHLSYVNGVLSASLKVSSYIGNSAYVRPDGLYTSSSEGSVSKIYFTSASFETGTNIYNNVDLAGKTNFMVWYRGMGFLLYNPDDVDDPTNEFRILETGGIEIIIPGFDVHADNNYFYILS